MTPYWTGDPVLSRLHRAAQGCQAARLRRHYPEISNAIQDAIQAAVSGQAPVADALNRAQATITPLLP